MGSPKMISQSQGHVTSAFMCFFIGKNQKRSFLTLSRRCRYCDLHTLHILQNEQLKKCLGEDVPETPFKSKSNVNLSDFIFYSIKMLLFYKHGSNLENFCVFSKLLFSITFLLKIFKMLMVLCTLFIHIDIKNVDGAMHFIYSHKYNTNSAEDSSDMN